jgi:hypothetical protein
MKLVLALLLIAGCASTPPAANPVVSPDVALFAARFEDGSAGWQTAGEVAVDGEAFEGRNRSNCPGQTRVSSRR